MSSAETEDGQWVEQDAQTRAIDRAIYNRAQFDASVRSIPCEANNQLSLIDPLPHFAMA